MPKCRTHTLAGAAAGAGLAAYHARHEVSDHQLVEIAGGVLGGAWGGRLPDLLEPATSPCHRDLAHSCLSLVAAGALTLEEWRRSCRGRAEDYGRRLANPELTSEARLLYAILEVVWRLAAGVLTGLQAGYASHLVLDGCTPSGLPLLVR